MVHCLAVVERWFEGGNGGAAQGPLLVANRWSIPVTSAGYSALRNTYQPPV